VALERALLYQATEAPLLGAPPKFCGSQTSLSARLSLDFAHVDGALAATARVLLLVKLDPIAATKLVEAGVYYRGTVEEQIFSTFLGNETETAVGQAGNRSLRQ
jgi:hypothetical protein